MVITILVPAEVQVDLKGIMSFFATEWTFTQMPLTDYVEDFVFCIYFELLSV